MMMRCCGSVKPHFNSDPRLYRASWGAWPLFYAGVIAHAIYCIMRCSMSYSDLASTPAKYKAGIDATKTETIRDGVVRRYFPRQAADDVEALRSRIGLCQVQGGRRHLVAQGQHGKDRFHAASRAQQMSCRRLGGGDGGAAPRAEYGLDGGELTGVANRRGGCMGVQVPDLPGGDVGLQDRQFHGAPSAGAVVGW